MSWKKRLEKEKKIISENPPTNVSAGPVNDDMLHWAAIINGPDDTPYSGGYFKIDILLPPDYPYKPPKCKFKTKVYHPNINSDGEICLNVLKDDWNPLLYLSDILLSISVLLVSPNPKDPLVEEAAKLYINDKTKYNKIAKEWTEKYASDISDDSSNNNNNNNNEDDEYEVKYAE